MFRPNSEKYFKKREYQKGIDEFEYMYVGGGMLTGRDEHVALELVTKAKESIAQRLREQGHG